MLKLLKNIFKRKSVMEKDRFDNGSIWWIDSRGQGCLDCKKAIDIINKEV